MTKHAKGTSKVHLHLNSYPQVLQRRLKSDKKSAINNPPSISHRITSEQITSRHIAFTFTSHHTSTSHHITSHHITSQHSTFTTHHIISNHITSHHIASHLFSFLPCGPAAPRQSRNTRDGAHLHSEHNHPRAGGPNLRADCGTSQMISHIASGEIAISTLSTSAIQPPLDLRYLGGSPGLLRLGCNPTRNNSPASFKKRGSRLVQQ